jgi:hypothetical protein
VIQEFGRIVDVPESFRERLNAPRLLRNWLVHSCFSDRSDCLKTDSGRVELIRELDQISQEFYELCGYLDTAIAAWLASPNPTEAALVSDLTVLMREA